MFQSIQFPVAPATAKVATDGVDLGDGAVDVPLGKLLDGRAGGAHPLHVDAGGNLHLGGQFLNVVGGITPGQSSYADGEHIGGVVHVAGVPAGLYRLQSVAVLGAQDLTGLDFHLAVYSTAPGATLSWPADGDPFSLAFDGTLGQLSPFGAEVLGWQAQMGTLFPHGRFSSVTPTAPFGLINPDTTPDANGDLSGTCDVHLDVMAAGPIATDLSGAPLMVAALLERVGVNVTVAFAGF